jgi:hypothetical protein
MMAAGGQVIKRDKEDTKHAMMSSARPHSKDPLSPFEAKSIAEAIMHANRLKMSFEDKNDTMSTPLRPGYADGGMVDLDSNEEEQPNEYYHQNEHEALDHDFDSDMDDMHQPADSNLHDPGDDLLEEDDEDDMVGKIMKRSKKSK